MAMRSVPFSQSERNLKKALISVFDKQGLVELCSFLAGQNVQLFATSSTRAYLQEQGFLCESAESLTGFPEVLGGRVKTLHPKIFAGILARGEDKKDQKDLDVLHCQTFDLVVCNLYPFSKAVAAQASLEDLYENIDIGGVSLLRAAAKNVDYLSVLCDPRDYAWFVHRCSEGIVPFGVRQQLSVKAFEETQSYDTLIATTLKQAVSQAPSGLSMGPLREHLTLKTQSESSVGQLVLTKQKTLRYGENPHQKAAWYTWEGMPFGSVPSFHFKDLKVLQGKELSYNNCLDMDNAVKLVIALGEPACVIVKHNVPCGAGWGSNQAEVLFDRAFEGDKISPFGGIVALNVPVDAACALKLSGVFLEVVCAPQFTPQALEILSSKKNLRLVENPHWQLSPEVPQITGISGGFLVQDSDSLLWKKEDLKVVSGESPTPERLSQMAKAMTIVQAVRSNAIVLVNSHQTIALAGGFTNRVDAVTHAIQKASLSLSDCILASDAFFPFPDSLEIMAKAGIKQVVQPGGSVQDPQVIAAAQSLGIHMVFTGTRHFKH